MTTAERLLRAKEDYDAVYAAGQDSMVDESKIVEKTVSGKDAVTLTDVSEIPHEVECKVESVNLLNVSVSSTTTSGITFTNNHDGTVTVNGTASAAVTYVFKYIFQLDANVDYYWRIIYEDANGNETTALTNVISQIEISNPDGGYLGWKTAPCTFCVDVTTTCAVYMRIQSGAVLENVTIKPMISFGTTALPYSPYVDVETVQVTKYGGDESEGFQTFTPSADGTVEGMTSVSPNMHILTDTEGVNIEVTYHKSYGMQKAYDDFWDSLQQEGARTNYNKAFFGWTEECFQPKYPIVSSNGATALQETVAYGSVRNTKVPIIAAYTGNVLNGTFAGSQSLHTIHSLEVNAGVKYTNTFSGCTALVNLTMAGEIGQNGFNVSASPSLTHDSLMSIINALKDYSAGTATYTVTLGATNLAKLSDAEKAIATQKGWTLA